MNITAKNIWDGDLIPLVPGIFGETLAIAGRTLCPTSGCWERLKWDLLSASSVNVSCSCMDIWLVFLTLILLTRFSHRGSLMSGGGQWADHVPRGCSRLIGISRWIWVRHLPGGWPDGGPWSTGVKWTQRRAALAHVPIPDLTCPVQDDKIRMVSGFSSRPLIDWFPSDQQCYELESVCSSHSQATDNKQFKILRLLLRNICGRCLSFTCFSPLTLTSCPSKSAHSHTSTAKPASWFLSIYKQHTVYHRRLKYIQLKYIK